MFATAFGDSITSARIGSFINANGKAVEQAQVRVASGKNVLRPADSVGDYFRTENYTKKSNEYGKVGQSIDEMTELLDYTEKANRLVWDDIYQMKSMVKDYYSPAMSEDKQKIIAMQFDQAKIRIAKTQEGAVWDGKSVLRDSSSNPLISINTDPHNYAQRYTVSFGSDKVVDAMGLDITAGEDAVNEALEAEWGKTASFAAQLTGYRYGLNAQRKMAEVIGDGTSESYNTIQDVDDVKELFFMTKQTIQQQAATSMLAQSGMKQSAMLRLVM